MKSLKTKAHIATTLVESVTEIPLRKLSVNDLCQRAEISRGAFYYHFQNIHELVCWIYDTEVVCPIQELISEDERYSIKIIDETIRRLYQNRAFYVQAFQNEGDNGIGNYAKKEIESSFQQMCNIFLKNHCRKPKEDSHIHVMLAYFATAHYYTVASWIKDGMALPPDEMIKILDTVSQTAILYTLNQETIPE